MHDIEKVKIWHYFQDSRVYNDTRTEVSADGINWRVLYDSDLSGTYKETPQGREYVVKGSEIYLKTILSKLGIEVKQEE